MSQNSPNIPRHIAIILDGNRRWAKKRKLQPWRGHFAGIGKNAESVMQDAIDMGIEYTTLWGGSYDNLTKRSAAEIKMLNKAYRQFINNALSDKRTFKNSIKMLFIGEWEKLLEKETISLIKKAHKDTAKNKKYNLTMLVAYNGDREMLDAIAKLKKKGARATDKELYKNLWTADLPPVDLVIRTGVEGDPHNSAGFMMWHTRYSQLYFTKKLWPDFTKNDLRIAIKDYQSRERRLGK